MITPEESRERLVKFMESGGGRVVMGKLRQAKQKKQATQKNLRASVVISQAIKLPK